MIEDWEGATVADGWSPRGVTKCLCGSRPGTVSCPHSTPRWIVIGIVIGVVIGVVAAVAFQEYALPRLFPKKPAASSPPAPASVEISPQYTLTGTAATIWTVQFCSGGTALQGSSWLCSFSLKVTNASQYYSYTVDQIQLVGATEASLTPGVPQTVGYGVTVAFALTISVPSNAASPLDFTVIVDSHG